MPATLHATLHAQPYWAGIDSPGRRVSFSRHVSRLLVAKRLQKHRNLSRVAADATRQRVHASQARATISPVQMNEVRMMTSFEEQT